MSSVVAGLRRMEEEAFGEEEEILREMEMEMDMAMGMEMEMEMEMGSREKASSKEIAAATNKAAEVVSGEKGEVEVGVGQVPPLGLGGDEEGGERDGSVLLSGFDDESRYDTLDAEKQRGQPLRLFKKRGQKRTTRMANMRPTRARRPAQDQEEEQEDVVPETQFNPSALAGGAAAATAPTDADELRLSDLDSDMDFEGPASDEETGTVKARQKRKAAANKGAENAKGEGVVKRAVRKVKATAHANFKRLKLRNTGTKGGPGHNSRFRRRR